VWITINKHVYGKGGRNGRQRKIDAACIIAGKKDVLNKFLTLTVELCLAESIRQASKMQVDSLNREFQLE